MTRKEICRKCHEENRREPADILLKGDRWTCWKTSYVVVSEYSLPSNAIDDVDSRLKCSYALEQLLINQV